MKKELYIFLISVKQFMKLIGEMGPEMLDFWSGGAWWGEIGLPPGSQPRGGAQPVSQPCSALMIILNTSVEAVVFNKIYPLKGHH